MTRPAAPCLCGHDAQLHVPGGGSCTTCPGCFEYVPDVPRGATS